MCSALTRYCRAHFKGRSNFWVHIYMEAFLVSELFVSIFDHISDPISEGLAQNAGNDITDPFAADLVELPAVRQVLVDLVGMLLAELLDRLQRELLVVRYRDMLGIFG